MSRKGLARTRRAWVLERGGVEEYDGRADPADRQRQREELGAAAAFPTRRGRCAALDGTPITQFEWARAGVITKEMIYVAERENLGRKTVLDEAEARLADGESFGAALPDFITPEFVRQEVALRPRHHPGQHQPHRTGADDHRPQLPGEDQRQHRQLGRLLLDGGRGREDGVGDPLGRRHGHGPVDRPQHPRHARMDRAQRAGADRHGADLPGAGEGRRRSDQARRGRSSATR